MTSQRCRFKALCFVGLVPTLVAVWCAYADETGVSYTVEVKGVADGKLRKALEEVSDAVVLRERLPATVTLLRRRVEKDVPRMVQALRSRAFYAADVRAHVDDRVTPVLVTFLVDAGPAYPLVSVDMTLTQLSGGDVALPKVSDLGLTLGEPAQAKPIVDAGRKLLDTLRGQGFPFPEIAERNVVVDHASRTVSVTFVLTPGPWARFGTTTFSGLASVDEMFVRGALPWAEGDPYDSALLGALQKRLARTGLFATIQVTPGEALDAKGRLPIAVALSERKHRTIRAGVGYRTDEGASVQSSWEHRNLLRSGERLTLNTVASEIETSFEGLLRKPAFRRPNQSLVLKLRMAHDDTDAFDSRGVSSEARLERVLSKHLELGGGVAFRNVRVKQFNEWDHFNLLSFPAYLKRDWTDDALDPAEGGRLTLKLAPFLDLTQGNLAFLKTSVTYSHYVQLTDDSRLVLAGRTRVGATLGVGERRIPADERFYAGGGGSIRGYPYQSVGPVWRDDPRGGRSVVELGVELRYKLNDRVGLVAFADGGTAMATHLPELGQALRWGVGVGARFYSPVGPIRFDVGIPLNRPDHVDDRYQVYLSLGHAF